MNKKQKMEKILGSCIVLSMVLTAFGSLLFTQTPSICYNSILTGIAAWVLENIPNNIIQAKVTLNPQSWSSLKNLTLE